MDVAGPLAGRTNTTDRRGTVGLVGHLLLANQAAKSADQGYREKVQKYTNLNIASGVAPLSITAWGFAQRDLEKALPFKEMVTHANGDKQVILEAAKMKDQWRRRVGLILLQENAFALRAYMAQTLAAGVRVDVARPLAGRTNTTDRRGPVGLVGHL